MQIRLLNKQDAQAFKEFRMEAINCDPFSFYPTSEEVSKTSLTQFEELLDNEKGNHVFSAWVNDELVAVVGCKHEQLIKIKHKAMIWGVGTKQAFRGQKIGKKVMQAAIAHAKSNPQIIQISLSVYDKNTAAKQLYISMGFKSFALEKNAMCIDGVFIDEEHMLLELA